MIEEPPVPRYGQPLQGPGNDVAWRMLLPKALRPVPGAGIFRGRVDDMRATDTDLLLTARECPKVAPPRPQVFFERNWA